MITLLRKWILRMAFYACAPLTLRDKVVLASNHSSQLQGNLKFIHEEMMRRSPDYQVVLLLSDTHSGIMGRLATLLTAIRAEYHLATARVFIVDDYYFPLYVVTPKPETVVIQTWHACGAFKKVGYSVLDKSFGASPALVNRVAIHSNYSYILTASQGSIPAYSEAFRQPAERFVSLGIPRTDLFFDEERRGASRAHVSERYSLPADKRVILYAPTFRGDSRHEAAYEDYLDLKTMAAACADEWVLLLRLHPFVASQASVDPELSHFVVDVSEHPDINELMFESDVLVTDYSSAIFEYSLLERPMLFFAPDYEAYEAERGFYFDYRTGIPGPLFTETPALAQFIAAGEFDLERVRQFTEQSFDIADGHASERFVTRLVEPYATAKAAAANTAAPAN